MKISLVSQISPGPVVSRSLKLVKTIQKVIEKIEKMMVITGAYNAVNPWLRIRSTELDRDDPYESLENIEPRNRPQAISNLVEYFMLFFTWNLIQMLVRETPVQEEHHPPSLKWLHRSGIETSNRALSPKG